MPFVTQEHRDKPDQSIPGDLCYVYYKDMMKKWKEERRWTTAHKIYKQVMECKRDYPISDRLVALELAWQVFFDKEVMKYEDEKEVINGKIE